MSFVAHCLAAFLGFSAIAHADPGLARNQHFEVYAQAGPAEARAALQDFERLRAYFLEQAGLGAGDPRPVRVILFQSQAEYASYQLRPAVDAYFIGTDARDLVILPGGADYDIRVAAHEYAHCVLHSRALQLPPWLSEGLSEFFSAVRLDKKEKRTRDPLPPRFRILQTRVWIPLNELVTLPPDSPLREQRAFSDVFYAQSWALAGMLMVSPEYRQKFPDLLNNLSSGASSDRALPAVYGRSLSELEADLRAWVRSRRVAPLSLPALSLSEESVEASAVGPVEWRSVLADLLLAAGKLDRAESAYEQLERESPGNPAYPAALALIALRGRRDAQARTYWRQALDQGFHDAPSCYRFAVLANDAGLPPADVEAALQRALSAQPVFDDAHYLLGLVESNAGRYESAVAQLREVRAVPPARQFAYWVSLAEAYTQLDQREEARAAASQASLHAAGDEERAQASQLLNMAETDLGVRFAPDGNGHTRLVTVRIPHDQQNWNPFIEPGDRIRSVQGKLRRIDCGGPATRVTIETSTGVLSITIADPARVLMRNAPAEFTCGPQSGNTVTVVYAAQSSGTSEGIVRGIEFD